MAQSTVVAKKYAEAAFNFAQKENNLGEWEIMLSNASKLLSDERVLRLFSCPDLDFEQRLDFLKSFEDDYFDHYFFNFLQILLLNGRIFLIEKVAILFKGLKLKFENKQEVLFISSENLSQEQKKKIEESFSKKLNKTLVAEYQIDESILGGLIARYGDKVVDGSVMGQLEKLKAELLMV